MPRPPGAVDPYQWTLDLPPGHHCSVGWSNNKVVSAEGVESAGGRPNEDKFYTCSSHNDQVQVYLVLDGHDGVRACEFAQKHLPSVFLRCDIRDEPSIISAVKTSFNSTEREFFVRIDPQITRKLTLQDEINQKARNSAEAMSLFPGQVQEMLRLDDQIRGGTTAVMSVVYNNKLFVANCGDSRAVLCSVDAKGQLITQQVSIDHNTQNESELQRLAECGLDPHTLRKSKRLGTQQNTRSIGDYSIKGGYTDVDVIGHASREPGTAEPYVAQPIDLTQFRGFLLLMTDGLYEAYEAWTRRPLKVNEDIGHLVAKEIRESNEFHLVAQNVVEKVKHVFQNSCKKEKRVGRLDDITLIVRNFGYPPLAHSQSYSSGMTSMPSHSNPASIATAPATSGATSLFFPPSAQGNQQHQFYSGLPPQVSGYQYQGNASPHLDFRKTMSGGAINTAAATNDPRFTDQPPFPTNAQHHVSNGGHVSVGGGDFYPEPINNQSPEYNRQGALYSNDPLYMNTGSHQWTGYPMHGPLSNAQMMPSQYPNQAQHAPLNPTMSVPTMQHPTHVGSRQQSVPVVITQGHPDPGPINYNFQSGNWTAPQVPLPTSPDSRQGQNYENTIPGESPVLKNASPSPRSSFYENVTLRAGEGRGSDQQRFSDSMLEEKTRAMTLQGAPVNEHAVTERRNSNVETTPPYETYSPAQERQASEPADASTPVAEPPQSPPKLVRRDSDAENMLLYGWTGKEPSSLVEEPKTLTDGDQQQYDTLKSETPPPPTMPNKDATPPKSDDAQAKEQEINNSDEETMTFDITGDFSEPETSENEEEDVDGCVKSYVKFADSFPHDLAWDSIAV